jgi:hypothetical protein
MLETKTGGYGSEHLVILFDDAQVDHAHTVWECDAEAPDENLRKPCLTDAAGPNEGHQPIRTELLQFGEVAVASVKATGAADEFIASPDSASQGGKVPMEFGMTELVNHCRREVGKAVLTQCHD